MGPSNSSRRQHDQQEDRHDPCNQVWPTSVTRGVAPGFPSDGRAGDWTGADVSAGRRGVSAIIGAAAVAGLFAICESILLLDSSCSNLELVKKQLEPDFTTE